MVVDAEFHMSIGLVEENWSPKWPKELKPIFGMVRELRESDEVVVQFDDDQAMAMDWLEFLSLFDDTTARDSGRADFYFNRKLVFETWFEDEGFILNMKTQFRDEKELQEVLENLKNYCSKINLKATYYCS